MRRILFISAMALACLLGPANVAGASGTAPKPAVARAPQISDAGLEAAIKAKLAKSKIGKDGFTVHVKSGIVTWEGSTNVIQHKGAATRMARTAGATQVVNNIKISGEARRRAAENLSGPLRKAQVKTN